MKNKWISAGLSGMMMFSLAPTTSIFAEENTFIGTEEITQNVKENVNDENASAEDVSKENNTQSETNEENGTKSDTFEAEKGTKTKPDDLQEETQKQEIKKQEENTNDNELNIETIQIQTNDILEESETIEDDISLENFVLMVQEVKIPTYTTPKNYTKQTANKTGFKVENQKTYYYQNGKRIKGQKQINGRWYYFDTNTGAMKTGFVTHKHQNKTVYYDNKGRMLYGFQTINGNWYYFNQGSGAMKYTGVVKNPKNKKWYFVKNGKGAKFTGWSKSIENGKWYFTRKGVLDWNFTGVAKSIENGKWYHGKKGVLDWKFTGLSKSVENGKWYFSRKGVLDWKYTGDAKSIANGKTYRVENGKVNFNYNKVQTQGANNPNVKIYKKGMLLATVKLAWQKEFGNGWGSNGCAPTSIANAINIANGNRKQNVNTVGQQAMRWGLISGPGGGGWRTDMAGSAQFVSRVYGLRTKAVSTKKELLKELDAGHTVLLQARTGYDGNYNERTILHAQLAIARNGNTIYIAESNAKRLGVAPHVRSVNINTLFSHHGGGTWLSIYK